jgi:hypothetical protein
MMVRRLLVLLLLVIGPIPMVASPAWACSCKEGAGIAEAELAFDGTVQSVAAGDGRSELRFAVDAVLKGAAGAEVTLTTSDHEAACGYRFETGARYRVYAVDGTTSLCSGNTLLATAAGAEPSARSQAGTEPAAADATTVFWGGTAVVTVLVAVGLLLLFRYPRSR